MDFVARLIAVLVLLLAQSSAWAYGETGKETLITCTVGSGAAGEATKSVGGTKEEACTAALRKHFVVTYIVAAGHQPGRFVVPVSCGNFNGGQAGCSGTWVLPTNGVGGSASGLAVSALTCVPGSLAIPTGKCSCPAGTKPNTFGKCEAYSCHASGSYSSVTQPDVGMRTVGNICSEGCLVKPSVIKTGANGQLWGVWPFISQGQKCEGSEVPETGVTTGEENKTPNPAPIPCSANLCPGVVNGNNVCVACSSTVESPSPAASAAPIVPGEAPVKGNSKTSTTTCTGNVCTTTTTTTSPGGVVIGTDTEQKPKDNLCADNPTLQICKTSAFGGSCGGAFTCEGDAIQCALAERVHKSACDWEQVDQNLKAIGDSAMNGQSRPDGHPFANPEAGSLTFSSVIDQTNRLNGGCPVDVAITYAGRSWVIPWSQHCDKLQLLGNLMVGVCMLAAAMIVFRS